MSLQYEIETELEHLKQSLIEIDRAIQNAPAGSLRLSPKKNGTNYYYLQYNDGNGKTRYEYISNKKRRLIAALAQKSYYKKLRPVVSAECRQLEEFIKIYDPDAKDLIFTGLGEARQGLVRPMFLSVEDTVKQWSDQECNCKIDSQQYSQQILSKELKYTTDRGEKVRSAAEASLANLFYSNRHRLSYRYAVPVCLKDDYYICPTFSMISLITGEKYYWEHVVLTDSPQCLEELIRKLNTYVKMNIFPGENLILTFESPSMPLDIHTARLLVKHYFPYRF